MTDFEIIRGSAINHAGRIYIAGEEDALERAGFSVEQKRRKHRSHQILWYGAAGESDVFAREPSSDAPAEDARSKGDVDATDAARTLAQAEGVDLRTLVGRGSGGRITKADVKAVL